MKGIQGRMGYCDESTLSATYGRDGEDKFRHDAVLVGYTVKKESGTLVRAYNEAGQGCGEWTAREGGMLAWDR